MPNGPNRQIPPGVHDIAPQGRKWYSSAPSYRCSPSHICGANPDMMFPSGGDGGMYLAGVSARQPEVNPVTPEHGS